MAKCKYDLYDSNCSTVEIGLKLSLFDATFVCIEHNWLALITFYKFRIPDAMSCLTLG